jgi:predicted nucleotidyltransferase
MSGKDQQILNKIISVVNKTAPDSELYLYGSRARGHSKKLSDWDLLILLQDRKVSFDFETSFMDALYEVELETGAVISPLIYSKTDWEEKHYFTPLFENIQQEGIRLI